MFEDRHLSFNKFLDERAEEISKFREILKQDTKKKGHQALPKSIRRRAMSHNRYRIPSKLRKVFEDQLIKSENMLRLPKCRKHIRKSPRLILSYKERHSKTKWLSTHLWAARRMRMIDYHGYKVAETPNQKCYRSSYRHFMHNCCMVDMSYFQCLTFWFANANDQLPDYISVVFEKRGIVRGNLRLSDLQVNRSYDGYLYNKQDRLVCPVIIFNSGKSIDQDGKFTIRCFFNPCALEQVKQLISDKKSQEVELSRSKSQLYCLLGPEWQNKLFQALKIYGFTLDISTLNQLKYNPGHTEFFISEQETKTQTVPYISSQISSLIKENYQISQESTKIRQQTLKLFQMLTKSQNTQQTQKSSEKSQNFWKFYQSILSPSQKVNITITTRSKYTHKRKNKMSKESKKKVAALQTKKKQLLSSKIAIEQEDPDSASYEMISQSLQNIKNQIKQFFIDEKDSKGLHLQGQNKVLKEKTYKVNPVLVTSFKKQSLYQGCYIFCSDDDSCRLWRILSKLNIKVIGLQEMRHITLESQHLSFPQDYPETRSFQNYAYKQAIKQMTRIKRLPPSKRINFVKVNSPNPFSSFEKKLTKNSHKVFIEMVNRGRCFTNSYIYELNHQDITLIEKELTQNGKIGIVLTQTTLNKYTNGSKLEKQKNFVDYERENLQTIEQKLGQLKEQRKMIGRVLTGGYLYTKSKEGGVGYVSSEIGNLLDGLKNDGYVLIRKVTSPHYYLAQITKIYPSIQRQ